MLSAELLAHGHLVRGTTRREAGLAEIEAVGAEAALADPDRIGTVIGAVAQVSAICVLLGSAAGSDEALAALHGPRLEMLMTRILDTTVRGVVYESAGSVDARLLSAGAALVTSFCRRSLVPFALLDRDPADGYSEWTAAALACVGGVIG